MTDEDIKLRAVEFAKRERKSIAQKLTDISHYPSEAIPVSVFMAGSPGAGKTELSRNLVSILEEGNQRRIIRVDGDEIRSLLPGYSGSNSSLFQKAISIIIDTTLDCILHNNQSFLLDGTFSHYERAVQNINRSLSKNRLALVCYVYQSPEIAWEFTLARELVEGRNISKDVFIDRFLAARETVDRIRTEFGNQVIIILIKKDYKNNTVEDAVELEAGGLSIDHYLPDNYTKEELERLL